MHFDWTINFGHIITVFGVVLSFVLWVRRLEKKFDNLSAELLVRDQKISLLWAWFKRVHKINGDEEGVLLKKDG